MRQPRSCPAPWQKTIQRGPQRFEALIAQLSARFVNLPAEQVDRNINDGLRRIVEYFDLDRGGVAEFDESSGLLRMTYIYAAPGVPVHVPVIANAQLPWYTATLLRGEPVRLEDAERDLPPGADAERAYCRQIGLRANLSIPISVGGAPVCVIACASFRGPRRWSDYFVSRFRLVGEVFANALARKRLDEARRATEEQHRILLETTSVIPWEAEAATGLITYIGPQIVSVLGYPVDRWSDPAFRAARLHPDDRERALERALLAVERGESYDNDYRMLAADGRVVWFHETVTVERRDGPPGRQRGYLLDVTARRQAELEARRLRDQLAHAGRVSLMGELASSLAHEVNQPLCAIISNARSAGRLLSSDPVDVDEIRAALDDIARDGERATGIIRRARSFLHQQEASRAALDLNEVVREMVAIAEHDLAGRGVRTLMDLAPGLPDVSGDRVQIQQVLLNLIMNGADALQSVERPNRHIGIATVRTAEGSVQVTVADDGTGIDPAACERLFEPFFTTKPEGMGMGLAICRSIVGAHEGELRVTTNEGGGATFHFTLPASEDTDG